MSNYTVSIKEMIEQGIEIFDFEYPYYNDTEGTKELFEQKFKDTFMYYEIGFEDIDMFKHYLKNKLVNLYPYYFQLYQTELRCKDIDFMLNKDLKETFTRDVTNELTRLGLKEGTNTDNSNVSSSLIDEYSESNNSNTKDSSVSNGVSSSELLDGYLTTVQSTNDNNQYDLTETNTSEITNNSTNTQSENIDEDSKMTETTELISQGNIGVTSSAELLEKWRKVLLNLDVMLLSDLRNLFLMIY